MSILLYEVLHRSVEPVCRTAIVFANFVLIKNRIWPKLARGRWFYWLLFGASTCLMLFYILSGLSRVIYDITLNVLVRERVRDFPLETLQELEQEWYKARGRVYSYQRYMADAYAVVSTLIRPMLIAAQVLRMKMVVSKGLQTSVCLPSLVTCAIAALSMVLFMLLKMAQVMLPVHGDVATAVLLGLLLVLSIASDILFLRTFVEVRRATASFLTLPTTHSRWSLLAAVASRNKTRSFKTTSNCDPCSPIQNERKTRFQIQAKHGTLRNDMESGGQNEINSTHRPSVTLWFGPANFSNPVVLSILLTIGHLILLGLSVVSYTCFLPITEEDVERGLGDRCPLSVTKLGILGELMVVVHTYLILKMNESIAKRQKPR